MIDLTKYGINGVQEIVYNPSYEQLFKDEMDPALTGFDKGQLTELDTVNVMTGIYTGRSPKDKFIVMDDTSRDTVWWTTPEYPNDNHPASQEAWDECKKLALEEGMVTLKEAGMIKGRAGLTSLQAAFEVTGGE